MKREGSILICFAGIDGSGKTTQARSLVNYLKGNGVKCQYVWNVYEPWLLKPFFAVGKMLFFRGKTMYQDYGRYSLTKRRIFRNPVISVIHHYLHLSEYLIRAFIKFRLLKLLNRNIVCDRYVYDMAVGLAAETGYSYEKMMGILTKLLHFLPKPNLVFLLDLPEEIAYQRKDDIPAVNYLNLRRQLYLRLANHNEMVILDGCGKLSELETVIQNKVKVLLWEGKNG